MQEIINQLRELREKDKFLLLDWEERGLNLSEPEVIESMKAEVNKFIDFIISNLESGNTSPEILTDIIQSYIDDEAEFWDDFDTEEREWIYDEFCPVIEKAG